MTLRDLDIKIDLEVNSSGLARVNRQIDQFVNKVKKIDDEINIRIDVDAVDAMTELHRLEMQLQRIERHTIDVDVDSAAAMAQLAALQAQLALLNGQRINPDFGGGFGGDGGLSTPFGAGLGMATKGLAAAMAIESIPLLIGTLGTAGYAIGALTNGIVALGSAIGNAGLGMGAFGLVAFTTISKLYDENAKLTKSQKQLKNHIDSLSYSYGVMEKAAQPLVYSTIGKGVNTIKTAIHMMTPIVDDAAIAIGGLFHSLNRSLQGERMTEFFDYIERSTGPMILNIGNGLGYALQGVANTMVALEPLTNWMAQGFENMFKRFADWSFLQKDTDGFADFINNTKDALSAIGDITGGAYEGIRDFFGAFEFTAVDGLEWLGDKMQDFAKWSSDLDNNQGFQDMLAQIAHDGPIVADTIGNIADAVERLYDVYNGFSDSLLGEDGIFGWINDKMDPSKAFEGFTLENVFKPGGPLNAVFPDLDWSKMLGLDKLGDTISNLDIGGWLSTAASNAGEWWGGVREGLSGAFEGAFDSLADGIAGIASSVGGFFSDAFSHVGGYVQEVGATLGTTFSAAGSTFFSFLSDGAETLRSAILGIGDTVSGWFSGLDIGGSISASFGSINWADFIPQFDWGTIATFNWSDFIPNFTWPSLPTLDWQSVLPPFSWPSLPSLDWSSILPSFSWPSIPTLSWSNFITKFNWPSLPSFSWQSFIDRFKWPSLPSFSWSGFIDKFKWPTLPKFSWPKVSVSDLLGKVGRIGSGIAEKVGFNTGIGNVPYDMQTTIHKGEAVIERDKAQELRNAGVLQGDGRYPKVDLSIPQSTSNTSSFVTTTSQSSQIVDVGGIQVHVHSSGGDGAEVANIVAELLSQMFSDLNIVMPMTREG